MMLVVMSNATPSVMPKLLSNSCGVPSDAPLASTIWLSPSSVMKIRWVLRLRASESGENVPMTDPAFQVGGLVEVSAMPSSSSPAT